MSIFNNDSDENPYTFALHGVGDTGEAFYQLTYSAGLHGTLSGITSQTVTMGSDGTPVIAVPDTGYSFIAWNDGVTTATRTDKNVTANIVVTANFASNPSYTLTVINGSGGGTYEPGVVVNILADVPALGMKFDKWTGDIANIADVNATDTTIKMPSSTTEITATYKVDESSAVKLTLGSVITINAADTPGSDDEFTSRPSVYGTYTDPVRFRDKKVRCEPFRE